MQYGHWVLAAGMWKDKKHVTNPSLHMILNKGFNYVVHKHN